MILFAIIKAIVSWLVLAFIITNLLGFAARNQSNFVNVISIFLMGFFFYLLLRYLHPGFMIAAVILSLGRIPDLVWELEHRQQISYKNMQNKAINIISSMLLWGALPVLFWAFYVS